MKKDPVERLVAAFFLLVWTLIAGLGIGAAALVLTLLWAPVHGATVDTMTIRFDGDSEDMIVEIIDGRPFFRRPGDEQCYDKMGPKPCEVVTVCDMVDSGLSEVVCRPRRRPDPATRPSRIRAADLVPPSSSIPTVPKDVQRPKGPDPWPVVVICCAIPPGPDHLPPGGDPLPVPIPVPPTGLLLAGALFLPLLRRFFR